MIREYITTRTLKEAIAGIASLALGVWIGVSYTVQLSINNIVTNNAYAQPEVINSQLPEWHSTALQLGERSLIFAGVCIIGWILLDYYWGETSD